MLTIQGDWVYAQETGLTANFSDRKLEFKTKLDRIVLIVEGGDVEFSWDGIDISGTLKPSFGPITLLDSGKSTIFLRGAGAATVFLMGNEVSK